MHLVAYAELKSREWYVAGHLSKIPAPSCADVPLQLHYGSDWLVDWLSASGTFKSGKGLQPY